jgi:hypothetical protein
MATNYRYLEKSHPDKSIYETYRRVYTDAIDSLDNLCHRGR